MGADIYMSLIDKEGNMAIDNLYDTCNYDWFDNICGCMCDFEYSYLPTECGLPKKVPKKIREAYEKRGEWGYTDFCYMNVAEYIYWFRKYRPDRKAGWVNMYDKWRIEKKNWIPESDQVLLSLDGVENREDYYFVEYEDEECPDVIIINRLIDSITAFNDYYIVYYFSH